MTRVVITGGGGFIGRHLVQRCLAEGFEALVVGRGPRPADLPPDVLYHESTLEEPQRLLPRGYGGEDFRLVHLAWETKRPQGFEPHARCVRHLAQLLDHWAPRGLRGVVGVGSAAEYGTRGGRLHESDAPLGPLSAYGWGKLSAGQLLEAWCQNQCPGQNQSVAATWLRPFVVYGPGQPAGMALGYVVDQVLQGKPALVTDGLQRRDFVHVEDVAEALVQALVRQPRGFQPINIASGTGVPVREVIARLSAMLGTDSLVRFGALPRRAAEPEEQFADTSAAETLLGWRAQIDWRSGIDRWASTLLSARRRRA